MIKVLLVEDDPMVAELNRSYVGAVEGFKVVGHVRTGEEALAYLCAHGGQTQGDVSLGSDPVGKVHRGQTQGVDLILLDVFMPGMQGLALLREIRAQGLGTDVILVTAASETLTIQEALRLGAVDYLIKPFEFERMKIALMNYKEKLMLLKQHSRISQTELDHMLREQGTGGGAGSSAALPKGLDRMTLKRICEVVRTDPQADFSAEEIAKTIGITRVSVRKYLDFMAEVKAVQMHVIYGGIGRPVHRYERLPGFDAVMKRYLEI